MQSSRLFSCFSFFDLNISDIKVCLHCRFSSVKAWKLTGDGWKFKAPWKCFWVVCLEIPDNVAGWCAWLSWSGPGLQLLNNNLRSLWFVNTEISSSRRLGWAWSKCWTGRKSCNQESRFWYGFDSIQTVLKSLQTQNQSDGVKQGEPDCRCINTSCNIIEVSRQFCFTRQEPGGCCDGWGNF